MEPSNIPQTPGRSEFGVAYDENEPQTPFGEELQVNDLAESSPFSRGGVGPDGRVDDPNSYKFFQSKFDKAEAENQRLREQVLQSQQMINQAYSQLSAGKAGDQQLYLGAGQTESPSQYQPPQRPEFPRVPASYDPNDAVFDPSSESHQFQQSQAEYMRKMGEYLDNQVATLDQRVLQIKQHEEEKARTDAWRTQLRHTHQMDDQQIDQFMKMMYDPSVLSLDNMVKFYRISNGQGVSPIEHQRKPSIPLPPMPQSTGGNAPIDSRSSADRIFDGMLRDEATNNAWGGKP